MASIVGKKIHGKTYYYLVESARVNGKPRIVDQKYLGTAQEVLDSLKGSGGEKPERTSHLGFGGLAAVLLRSLLGSHPPSQASESRCRSSMPSEFSLDEVNRVGMLAYHEKNHG